ncbi:hypothetical protein MA5S0817_4885 [Mycobacteroides abscessus 5S-0817]|nr:hypothetical protein MA5S0817_4885 [Mycobacteroides abscessus 5S-0817]
MESMASISSEMAHGPELGGEAAAGLGGERDRGHDRSQLAGVHQ